MPDTAVHDRHDRFGVDWTIAGVAETAGAKIATRIVVRFPIEYEETLRAIIERRGLVGRISIDYSEGRACMVTWEGTRG